MRTCDVAVVGGGPAGLQCALLLARARRRVVVIDSGRPRNETVREAHGFFSRDGISPHELLEEGRRQLLRYDCASVEAGTVDDIRGDADAGFIVTRGAEQLRARRVVLATGMRDRLPEIEGLDACWGLSAFICPYCDGWEVRDRPIAIWGNTRSGIGLAQELFQWTDDIVVCTGVDTPVSDDERTWAAAKDVEVVGLPIARLVHERGMLQAIEFEDGTRTPRSALFLSVTLTQACDLPERVGCRLTERGHIDVDVEYRTSVRGIYAVGDAVTYMHQIVFSAASGARAAIALNNELLGIA
jgi:thioredoxin reductase